MIKYALYRTGGKFLLNIEEPSPLVRGKKILNKRFEVLQATEAALAEDNSYAIAIVKPLESKWKRLKRRLKRKKKA